MESMYVPTSSRGLQWRGCHGDGGLLGGSPAGSPASAVVRAYVGRNDPREDDCVRLFDEVLGAVDWSPWEVEFGAPGRGQPPIHPRHLAAAILYGLYRGIRSSRKLEEACCYRLDFIWLLEGRRLDHSTLAKFRTRFRKPLKDLFRQLGRIALAVGLVRLGEVAFDGTRVKASNSRFQTRAAKTLEAKLQALDALYEHLLAESESQDIEQVGSGSPTRLPEEFAALEQRREKLLDALDQVRAADEARRQQGVNPKKNPARIPTTDPDARVMPNKEGGYAPNYTQVATTDGYRGFIVDCEVTAEVNEGPQAVASVDRIEETFGQKPERLLTDTGRKLYNQRPHIAETTFGLLKRVMGLRQFFLRGLEKVKTEWRWACTAFNLGKLVREMARLRAERTQLATEA